MTEENQPPKRASGTRARSPVVLLVEDHADLRAALADGLTLEGFSVAEARDGQEAVDRARTMLPDIILMDLSLPVLDGASAASVLRTYASTSEIPIVALTGMAVDPSEAPGLGLDGIIRKPCAPQALAVALRGVLLSGPRRRRSP